METQEYYSQEDTQEEYHSTVEQQTQYCSLKTLFKQNFVIEFSYQCNKFGFGREAQREFDKFYVFDRNDFANMSSYGHISKVHFYLEKFSPNHCTDFQYKQLPVAIYVVGRNGLYVNDLKLNVGDNRLLRDGDIIKLSKNTPLFCFSYKNNTAAQLPACKELKDYFVGDSIGSGGNGHVYLTFEVKPNDNFGFSTYALKNIKKKQHSGLADIEKFNENLMREVDIMSRMKNPHILELIKYFNTPSNLIILIPMMFGGDLLHRIQEHGRLTEADSKFFNLQLLLGLAYMHSKGIAHRDIKCDNLLLSDHGSSPLLKISDFGLSKILQNSNTVCGTKLYASPEIINNEINYTYKVDIWSAGVVLYAMLSGTFPFYKDDKRKETLEDLIRKGKFHFPQRTFEHVSESSKHFVRLMLQVNPVNRWEISLLLRHGWMRDPHNNRRLDALLEDLYEQYEGDDDTFTEEIGKNLENVAINDNNIQYSKRPRLG